MHGTQPFALVANARIGPTAREEQIDSQTGTDMHRRCVHFSFFPPDLRKRLQYSAKSSAGIPAKVHV
eukprot:4117217-Amphidinium_carterae.1